MRCRHCGKKINKKQAVCPWCGESQKAKKVATDEQNPEQVRLSAKGTTKRRRLTDKQRKWLIGIAIAVGAILLAAIVTVVSVIFSMLGNIQRESELSAGEIGINSALPAAKDVKNIALFGLDTRNDDENGRSDAIIILSIDRVHDKIKLTSIARDTLLPIEGYGQSKITHAFGWGKAKLAVKTINQNFGMNITDYAYINFYEFAEIIDFIGGVMIDVDSSEASVMNNHYGPELRRLGFKYVNVSAGYQRLNGPQALAYSRNRYSDSDVGRGNRQKEVLEAMFTQVKDTPLTKYTSLISQILGMCHTTLSNSELMSIATWAVGNAPTFEQFSLPSKECNAQGGNWNDGHGWVYRYDLSLATDILHQFIYEEEAPAGVVVSPTARPTVTAAPVTTTTASSGNETTTTTIITTTTTTTAGTTATTRDTRYTQPPTTTSTTYANVTTGSTTATTIGDTTVTTTATATVANTTTAQTTVDAAATTAATSTTTAPSTSTATTTSAPQTTATSGTSAA